VESTLAEVLILGGLAEGGISKVVTWEVLKISGEYEGLRGGDT